MPRLFYPPLVEPGFYVRPKGIQKEDNIVIFHAVFLIHCLSNLVESSVPEFIESVGLAGNLHIVSYEKDAPALFVFPPKEVHDKVPVIAVQVSGWLVSQD